MAKKSTSSVRDVLRIMFRRKWALLVPSMLGVLVAPTMMLQTPKYRAVALVRREDPALVRSTPSSLLARPDVTVSVDNVRAEILTWTSLKQVIVQTKLDANLTTARQWQRMYAKLAKAIKIRAKAQSRGVDLIEIEVTHEDPSLAEKIANHVADNYVEESKRTGRSRSQDAVDFYEKGADEYLAMLRATEGELEQYTEDHFQELPQVKQDILRRMLDLRTSLTSKAIQLTEAQSRLYELEDQVATVPRTIQDEVINEGNPRAVVLKDELARAKRMLVGLQGRLTDEHPDMLRLRSEIANIEMELAQTPDRIESSTREVINPVYQQLVSQRLTLRQAIRAYAAGIDRLDAELQSNQTAVRNVVDEERRYTDLTRLQRQYDRTYSEFQQGLVAARKSLEVRANEDAYGTSVRLLAPALEPAIPWHRGYLKLMAMCLMAGVAAGVGLMFAMEFCDQSLRSMDDAAQFLKVPVLGTISTIVTPDQASASRRRRLAVVGTVVAVLLIAGLGLYYCELQRPGTLDDIVNKMKQVVGHVNNVFG